MLKKFILMTALAFTLVACSDTEQVQVNLDPVAFHSGDECHVCGMIISEWPGPKGEVIEAKGGEVLKFCATTDMFSWVLQPENKNLNLAIYVHDMGRSHWDTPNDEHLIDARAAFYVMGSAKMGMGPTLASFASQEDAASFAAKEGGKVVSYAEINEDVLREITMLAHEHILHSNEQIHHEIHGEAREHEHAHH